MKEFILQFINCCSTGEVKKYMDSLTKENIRSWITGFNEIKDCKKNTTYSFIFDWIKFQERKILLTKYLNKWKI